MGEEWRPVVGYEDEHYEVSSYGRVRRKEHVDTYERTVRGEKKLVQLSRKEYYYKPHVEFCGYIGVRILKDGHESAKLVHRLVAEAFIPNDDPEHKILIDHIDGNRQNNNVDNLRWVTHRENSQNVNNRADKIMVRCLTDGKIFSSVSDAERFYGIPKGMISGSADANMKTHGLKFKLIRKDKIEK